MTLWEVSAEMARLYDLAKVVRSKNSGPFEITLDALFDDPAVYERVKRSGVINKELIAKLYHVPVSHVTTLAFFDPACGFKATFARRVSSGTCLDSDVYGAQQHVPLAQVEIPDEIK